MAARPRLDVALDRFRQARGGREELAPPRPVATWFGLHFRDASPTVCDADVLTSAAALIADFEHPVRDCFGQYPWSDERFRVRPRGEANPHRRSAHAQTAAG